MSAAALLVIVVASGEAHDPATAIMAAVAAESLGTAVSVQLLPANRPEQIDAAALERDLGASAIVTLIWTDAARLQARLRLHVAGSDRTITREIAFAAADSRGERGRTLGLAAASMWPEIARSTPALAPPRGPPDAPAAVATSPGASVGESRPAPDASPPVAVPGARAPGTAAGERPAGALAPAAVGAGASPAVGGPTPGEGRTPGAPLVRAGLSLIGIPGLAGSAPALGGRVEAALRMSPAWWLRLGFSLRRATIAALPGHDYAGQLAAGVEWWPDALSSTGAVAAGVRADVMALRHDVRGTVIPDQPEQRVRYLPAADLFVQVAVRVARHLELLAAAGAEAAGGRTHVRRGTMPITVATIPAFALTAEAGLRVGF